MNRRPIWAAAVCLFSACSGGSRDSDYQEYDSDAAYEAAAEQLEGETFEDVGDTSMCTEDCGGHDAGFEWARDKGFTDASDCGGNSPSFIEGCEAYVEALDEAADELDDGTEWEESRL